MGVIQRIINYDRDLLFLRNLQTNLDATLPLDRVVDQMHGMEQVLLHAASAERNPRPFLPRISHHAREIVHGYSFGHTLPGSFIFTVSAPRLPRELPPVQLQLLRDESEAPELQEIAEQLSRPLVRRISERIARGLLFSRQARRNYSILLEEYQSGFNANMCKAIVDVAADGDATVELQIAWSPKLPPARDVANLGPIQVSKGDCENLRFVARELKNIRPEPATVIGRIRGLLVSGNPDDPKSRRAVILQGMNPTTRRPTSFIVELPMEDYDVALAAHRRWAEVQIRGIPLRTGDGWRLTGAHNFAVIG